MYGRVYNLFLLLILEDTNCCHVLCFMTIKSKRRLLQSSALRTKQTESFLHLYWSSFCLYIYLLGQGSTLYELPLLLFSSCHDVSVSECYDATDITLYSHLLLACLFVT